jgi:nucleoside-diphosphate-sugar epimerase
MNVFLAGGTGAIGRRLITLLVGAGHRVHATTRRPEMAGELEAAGARPFVLDALDAKAVLAAVSAAEPDVVVNQLSSLTDLRNLKKFDQEMARTNVLRTEGNRALLKAAQLAGARRFVAQSYTGWPNERRGGRLKGEDDPFDDRPPVNMIRSLSALRTLEKETTEARDLVGIALRYGFFYGPGTAIDQGGSILESVRRRQFPVVGGGAGIWSFIHVDDAAAATLRAIESGPAGVYNIVDDNPTEVSEWLPGLARILGAGSPYRIPAWLGKLMIGEPGAVLMTSIRGSSNAKAKRQLGWAPRYPSWKEGFTKGL